MALPGHYTTERYNSGRSEPELLRPEHRGDYDVATGLETAVNSKADATSQFVHDQRLLRLREPQFPGRACILYGAKGRGSRSAIVSRDVNDVSARFGDACRDRADSRFRHKLDRHASIGIDLLQVVDELRKIFD